MTHSPLAPLVLALLAGLPARASQAPAAAAAPTAKPYPLNGRIEGELNLSDLDGKPHALFAENPERVLVLVFWSYRDPVSRFYAQPLAELQRTHAERLRIVLVDSNHDELVAGVDPLVKLRAVLEAEKVTLPVWLDHGNALADAFGATANGQAYLLDANRFLRYHGGIDDDPDGARAKQGLARRAWLENALTRILAGERPDENWTRPAGRALKRAPKAPAAGGAAGKKP